MSTSKQIELLRKIVRELIQQELGEASMTGNLDGGAGPPKTPYAFQSKPKSKKDKEKEDDMNKATGYTKVNEAKFHVKTEMGSVIVDATGKAEAIMKVAKALKKGRKGVIDANRVGVSKAKQVSQKLENVNEVTDKEISALSDLIASFDKIQRDYFNIKKLGDKELKNRKYDKVYYKAILDCKEKIKDLLDIFYKKNVGLNEGKYHVWRNDETMTPKQKIGKSVREVRHALDSLDKTIKMSVRLKNELNVDSRNYWKNTHKALQKISERLVKLATKVGSLK